MIYFTIIEYIRSKWNPRTFATNDEQRQVGSSSLQRRFIHSGFLQNPSVNSGWARS